MYPGLLYLLYPCPMHCYPINSTVKPASGGFAAWCRDDEDVSHNRTSVRWILNGTKCHTEQSATSYTWWGPPLESVGATSRIHSPQSKVPHGAKCHTTHGGHLLNLYGYLLIVSSGVSVILHSQYLLASTRTCMMITPRTHVIWFTFPIRIMIPAYRSSDEFYWMCGLQSELSDVVGRRWESDKDNIEHY